MFGRLIILFGISVSLFGVSYNITKNKASQNSPSISQNFIAWQDYRNKNSDIYIHDLTTKATTKITSNPDYDGNPIVDGNYVVYESSEGGKYFLNLYDIAAAKKTVITERMTNGYDIDGNTIVWAENGALYIYDINNKAKIQIIKKESSNWAANPSIDKDKIVWNEGNSIFMYSLSDKSKTKIAQASSPKAKIFGNYIVWESSSPWGGKTVWNIYLYEISSNKTLPITKEPYINKNPQIFGNRVVWHSNKNGNWDIFSYNIDTKTVKQITFNPADQTFPSIYENHIVWVDERDSNEEIYFANLGNYPISYVKHATPYMNTSSSYRTYLKVFNTDSCAVNVKALVFDTKGNYINEKNPLDITFNIFPMHSKIIYAKDIKSKASSKGVNLSDSFGAVLLYYCKNKIADPNKIFSQVVQKSPLGQRVMPVYDLGKTLTGKGKIVFPHLYQKTSDKHSEYRGFLEFLNIGDKEVEINLKAYLKNGKMFSTSYKIPPHSIKFIKSRDLYPKLKIPYGEPISVITELKEGLEYIYPVEVQKTPYGPRVLEAFKRK